MRGLGLGGVGVVRQTRHLEGDAAVARLPLVHRPQQVAGVADVGGGDGAQCLLDADLPDRQRVQLVVVGLEPLIAAAKIVGLVVTPTTPYSSTSDCRLRLRMRSRDRSSSHTATPAEDSSATSRSVP